MVSFIIKIIKTLSKNFSTIMGMPSEVKSTKKTKIIVSKNSSLTQNDHSPITNMTKTTNTMKKT
jgi:hypothetical protein